MAERKLHGIFTPHMIPLDNRGQINEAELRRLIEFLITRGVHGLYPNGSTSEFTRFSEAERREIVRIVADQARGRVQLMPGAAEANVQLTLEACEYYHSLGCDAAAVVPPYYFKLSQPAVREYYATLARHSPIGILLYNIPQFSNPITIDTMKRLSEYPRIVGVKDSSRDLPFFMNLINELRPLRPDFCYLTGCEEIFVPAMLVGADGGTIATSGVVPELVVKMYDLARGGNLDEAMRLQYSLLLLIKATIFGVSFPEGIREALKLRGFEMGQSRQPLAPEERLDIDLLRATLQTLLSQLGCGFSAAADGLPLQCAGPSGDPNGATDEALVRDIVERVVRRLGAR